MKKFSKILAVLQLIVILSCNSASDEYVYLRKVPFKDNFRVIEKKDHIEYDKRFCKVKKSREFPLDEMIKYGDYAINIKGKVRYEVWGKENLNAIGLYKNCDENIENKISDFLISMTKKYALNILPLFNLSTLSESEPESLENFQNIINENFVYGQLDLSSGKIEYCFDDDEFYCDNKRKREDGGIVFLGFKIAQTEIDNIYVYPM